MVNFVVYFTIADFDIMLLLFCIDLKVVYFLELAQKLFCSKAKSMIVFQAEVREIA